MIQDRLMEILSAVIIVVLYGTAIVFMVAFYHTEIKPWIAKKKKNVK
jgi:succinate dehydrogenase hydrophobic anchor subunit